MEEVNEGREITSKSHPGKEYKKIFVNVSSVKGSLFNTVVLNTWQKVSGRATGKVGDGNKAVNT